MERESFCQSRVDDAVAQWETLIAHGKDVSPSQFCERCPASIREEVAQRIHALQSIDALLGGVETESRLFDDVATGEDGPSQPKKPPPTLGRYQLLEMVGQGGFGQVWRSRDTELERDVAIKIPRPDRLGSPEQAKRFLEEARKAAKLDHPGIVPVYDSGRQGSRYFIVSKWIDGPSLAERLKGERLSPDESTEIVAQVADALNHAHSRDLVHRDVKPGNILLDTQGRAYVTDFGIAVTGDELLRESGSISGTPTYMAPEQASGEVLRITPRTDIYSLGVVLYELLTGRLPFQGKSLLELREQICRREPWSLRAINPTLPADLERICLKAMAKDPGQRYATAGDMAGDLRRHEMARADDSQMGDERREGKPRGRLIRWSVISSITIVLIAAIVLSTRSLLRAPQSPVATEALETIQDFRPVLPLADQRIEDALNSPTVIEFIETPLEDVVDYLIEQHGIDIKIDRKAFDDIGMPTDIPITANLNNVSLRLALGGVLSDRGLTYAIANGVLVITTPEEAETSLLATRTYPIADLVLTSSHDGGEFADYELLIEMIVSTVAPQSWAQVGGPGDIAPLPFKDTHLLVVSQTLPVHHEIEQLLAGLRRSQAAARPQ